MWKNGTITLADIDKMIPLYERKMLDNSLGVELETSTDVLYVYEDGHFKVGFNGSGTMKTFKPQGKR